MIRSPNGARASDAMEVPDEQEDDGLRHVAITKKGYVPYNKGKRNQDSYIIAENLLGDPTIVLYGVCDGHGEFGHYVASFLRDRLPHHLNLQGETLRNDTVLRLLNFSCFSCVENS
jgi:serine/threonine protein phosphatase PrpC